MVATVRCAPPANKPTVAERDTCAPWLRAEIELLSSSVRVVVALGAYGWAAALAAYRDAGYDVPRPRPRFAHAAEADLGGVTLLGSYHPSQHNTFTGRLTPGMLDDVFLRARALADSPA
jgi:uracil-DNA glycosylase